MELFFARLKIFENISFYNFMKKFGRNLINHACSRGHKDVVHSSII